jgi:hypothetical protein
MSNSPENQAPSELPSQNIFANLIGGPDLHVPDWAIYDHIIPHGQSIKGGMEYLIYVRFILEKSAGRINRAQWHSRSTILKLLKMKTDNLSRYEPQWIADGWLLKYEGGGRDNSHRALGRQFDHIRIRFYNHPKNGRSNYPHTSPQSEGRSYPHTYPQSEGRPYPQSEGSNPNNLNPNLSLSSYEEREREQKAKEALPFNEGAPQEEKKLSKVEQNPYFLSDAIGRKRSK